MKNIKEAEAESGINKQNIRYYEKMGLLHPDRNTINGYRKYSEEDIRRLKFIYLFRKLDMPLEEIRNLLDGAIDLPTALAQQKDRLKAEQERIQGAILFCEGIQERKLEELDVDNCLQKMEAEEKRGSLFANILYDYKRVIKGESIREISFIPDDFCTTPEQMTEQLLKYADENKRKITFQSICQRKNIMCCESYHVELCGELLPQESCFWVIGLIWMRLVRKTQ